MTIEEIRAAATAVGRRYMAEHPDEKPEGTALWTERARWAANSEMHRLTRLNQIDLYKLPS